MSSPRLQNFRSFLTEQFTSMAVGILGEVESIVEAYYEENKRLRNILHMVLNPEINLSRIDATQHSGAPDVREQPPEPNTEVDPEISEPLAKKPKEEPMECTTGLGSEHQRGQEDGDNFITPVFVKNDPVEEKDTSMPIITNVFQIKVVECHSKSSATVSADEGNSEHVEFFSWEEEIPPDCLQLPKTKESTNENQEAEKCCDTSKKNPSTYSLQKTVLNSPRIMPLRALIDAQPDCQSFLVSLTEDFKDLPDDKKPLITKMGLTANVEPVDCATGKVSKGCPQPSKGPVPSSQDFKIYSDAPSRPLLPLPDYTLGSEPLIRTLSAEEEEQLKAMHMTWGQAYNLERSTRRCSSVEELQSLRLTNHFRKICNLKPGKSNAENLIWKIKKGLPRSKVIDEEMKAKALGEYCRHLCVNWFPCGLVVNPTAPWLGAMPDGLVYDPNEKRSFGLVHIKCIKIQSFISCNFLSCQDKGIQVKKSHPYYWHIQGELMVTGMSWCDLLVFSTENILVQRIYRNKVIIKSMKKKLDAFFFHYYLPSIV